MARNHIVGTAIVNRKHRAVRRRPLVPVDSKDLIGGIHQMSEEDDSPVLSLLKKKPNPPDHFRGGPLHVSDVIGKCIRKIALSQKLCKPMPTQSIPDGLGLTFAQGRALHTYVTERYMRAHPDKVYGRFACVCGALVTSPTVYANLGDTLCPKCEQPPTKYVEMDFTDEELGIVGSPDLLLHLKEIGAYYPIELKSMAYDEWKNIVRPLPDHVIQLLFYWYLMQRAGYPVVSQVSTIYISKGYLFGNKSPYKEFVIPVRTVTEAEDRLALHLNECRELKTFSDTGEIPPRTLCKTADCATAKGCHVSVFCFAL